MKKTFSSNRKGTACCASTKAVFVICLLLLLHIVNPALAQESGGETITHDGIERTYYVYVPESYDGSQAVPLVIGLHGAGGSAVEMAYFTNLDDIADVNGFLLVYPNAIDARWDYLDVPLEEGDTVVDDVGFIGALIDKMTEDYRIDESRVYVFGFSNGGLMSVRLRCALADRLAAVAAIGATMTFGLSQECLTVDPLPYFLALGTQDSAFPWQGQIEVENGVMYGTFSLSQTISFMVSINACDATPEVNPVAIPNSPVGVIRQVHNSCADGAEVVFYALIDLDHTWPTTPVIVLESGETGSIEQAMWEFFARHARKGK